MSKKFILGMLIGIVGGTVLGILFAPKKGKETREDIKNIASDIKNQIAEKVSQIADITKEKYKSVVEEILGGYTQSKRISSESSDKIKKEMMEKFEKIKNIIES